MTKKVLIVLTNIERYETSKRLTGLWLGELTHFYDEMVKANIAVDFVSPKGGYVPLDPHSLTVMEDTDWTYYQDSAFRNQALANSMSPEQINADDYDTIYYTGGHGTMWDFPQDNTISDIANAIYKKGGFVTSVCHGAVGLLPLKDENGQALIKGKKVAGFSNAEEEINKTTDLVPFLTQDELTNTGGIYQEAQAFQPFVAVDGRLISGQNPQSARQVGQKLVDLLSQS